MRSKSQLQPDVATMLSELDDLGLPPFDALSAAEARELVDELSAQAPPGPSVGQVVDGRYPGAAGDLNFRLYRPNTEGPHPIVLYFHGGGWVLGHSLIDGPFCRDLCVRTDAIVLSVDYRHAPESPFPAAPEDAIAALRWAADNAERLGGLPGKLVVAGWSAGANLATVACQLARDSGGPTVLGQMLLTPATDCDLSRPSYSRFGEGYFLTGSLMEWFWDHYATQTERQDPLASPLRALDLSGLPPALVVTAEFDVLSDEGLAYADALRAAGVRANHLLASGHIHTSITAVDVVESSVMIRSEMARAVRRFFAD